MLRIEFNLLKDEEYPKKEYSKMSYGQILLTVPDYEEIEIIFFDGDSVFFKEPCALIEFYWFITQWYAKYNKGIYIPFVYETIEFYEPILTFKKMSDSFWQIDSIWKELDHPLIVNEDELISVVDNLVAKLRCFLEP